MGEMAEVTEMETKPSRVYTVVEPYSWRKAKGEQPSLESAAIKKLTGKQVDLESPGLLHRIRYSIDDPRIGFTPEDAARAYHDLKAAELDRARAAHEGAMEAYMEAEALLARTVEGEGA